MSIFNEPDLMAEASDVIVGYIKLGPSLAFNHTVDF
jgi:hypothetical protein